MPELDSLLDVDTQFATLTKDVGRVDDDECLYCYLLRMLRDFGCSGTLNWTLRWCEFQLRPTGWVPGWVRRNRGYCDCEVVLNVFGDDRRSARHRRLRCEASYAAAFRRD